MARAPRRSPGLVAPAVFGFHGRQVSNFGADRRVVGWGDRVRTVALAVGPDSRGRVLDGRRRIHVGGPPISILAHGRDVQERRELREHPEASSRAGADVCRALEGGGPRPWFASSPARSPHPERHSRPTSGRTSAAIPTSCPATGPRSLVLAFALGAICGAALPARCRQIRPACDRVVGLFGAGPGLAVTERSWWFTAAPLVWVRRPPR